MFGTMNFVGGGRQLGDHALDDRIGDVIQQGFDMRERAVFHIMRFVENGDINPGDVGKGFQDVIASTRRVRGNLLVGRGIASGGRAPPSQ